MKKMCIAIAGLILGVAVPISAQSNNPDKPTWWDKYQYLASFGSDPAPGRTTSLAAGPNVDVSNECGPQSETFITINPSHTTMLAAGSNEIFRDPMRGYFSTDGGATWGGVDVPLPPPLHGTNDHRFGSDPGVAFDTSGNLFYSYIVVYFGNGNGVKGTEMAVARSTDGGQTYPSTTLFSFQSGANHFNDKPMITADTSATSPHRDNVYVAWDAASGGTTGGGVLVGRSSDHGASFAVTRVDDDERAGQGDRRVSRGRSGRRGVRRVERLQGQHDRVQPLVPTAGRPGARRSSSRPRSSPSTSRSRPSRSAALSSIRPATRTARAERTAAACTAPGWI